MGNLCGTDNTTYTYDTNARLSKLLTKTTTGTVTKYVYGLGLIGEETAGSFKTYHFDYRGSTVAITDSTGAVTDTFTYDTYGRLTARTGTSTVIFGYNGQDGVVTDANGLLYMRARYYSPELRRFINADIVSGKISNAITLNRYAYANGNPVSNVDPFGLDIDENKDMNPFFKLLYSLYFKSLDNEKKRRDILATILKKMLSYKDEIHPGHPLLVGLNTYISLSLSQTFGDGDIEILSDYSEQLELLSSISFEFSGKTSYKVNKDGSIEIGYSYDVDDHTSVSASISTMPWVYLSADYTVTTKYSNSYSLSTSFELTHTDQKLDPVPETVEVPEVVTVPKTVPVPASVPYNLYEYQPKTTFGWMHNNGSAAAAMAAAAIAGAAIAGAAMGGNGAYGKMVLKQ